MVAMYFDFGLGASPDELDYITSCQVGQETVLLRQESPWRVGTQIELACFLPGVVTIAVIVAGFIGAAVASHVALVPKNRSDYAVGLTLTEIALFARADIGDIKGKLLFSLCTLNSLVLPLVGSPGIVGYGVRMQFWERKLCNELVVIAKAVVVSFSHRVYLCSGRL